MVGISKYHLKLIKDLGAVQIWEIDGAKLRAEKDIEFSNFGMYPDFDYIPQNELWLDHECHPDEQKFFIDHMFSQWKALKHGYTNDQAIEKAYKVEKAERKKAGDNGDVHVKKYGETSDGLTIWIVNGRLVRSKYFIDFVEGGHFYVYPWVPKDEVWLDDDLMPQEFPFVLLHELNERNLMSQGWIYDKAHENSSAIEFKCHQDPALLAVELGKHGFSYRGSHS